MRDHVAIRQCAQCGAITIAASVGGVRLLEAKEETVVISDISRSRGGRGLGRKRVIEIQDPRRPTWGATRCPGWTRARRYVLIRRMYAEPEARSVWTGVLRELRHRKALLRTAARLRSR